MAVAELAVPKPLWRSGHREHEGEEQHSHELFDDKPSDPIEHKGYSENNIQSPEQPVWHNPKQAARSV